MPFMKNGKRDFQAELKWEHENKPNRVKERSARNTARAAMVKAGKIDKNSPLDVDHKKPLARGGDNSLSNLRPMDPSKNRSVKRTSTNKMKGNGR